jgi:hypothetical protein
VLIAKSLRKRYRYRMDDDAEHPQFLEHLYPDPATGPLRARLWIAPVDGRPAVVGVELWGVDPKTAVWPMLGELPEELPDAPIRASDVRLPLGRYLDAWVEKQRASARASRALWPDVPGHEETVRKFERRLDGKRAGRPRLSGEFLERVATVYSAAVEEGDSRPALRVQEELDAAVPETARGWIRQARKRGFLAPATPSRSAGSPVGDSPTDNNENGGQ